MKNIEIVGSCEISHKLLNFEVSRLDDAGSV